jgi:hypothetical protein
MIMFNIGERNFFVSSPKPIEKYIFLCVYSFFLCGYPHRKIIFNLGERNFSVRVRPTEKLFLMAKQQKNRHYISVCYFLTVHLLEKYFFLWVFVFFCGFLHT